MLLRGLLLRVLSVPRRILPWPRLVLCGALLARHTGPQRRSVLAHRLRLTLLVLVLVLIPVLVLVLVPVLILIPVVVLILIRVLVLVLIPCRL